jgi:hypothetical protein
VKQDGLVRRRLGLHASPIQCCCSTQRGGPLNTWPKWPPFEGFHTFRNHHTETEAEAPTGHLPHGCGRTSASIRGLWEDEMYDVCSSDAAALRTLAKGLLSLGRHVREKIFPRNTGAHDKHPSYSRRDRRRNSHRYLAACAGKWPNRVHPKESLKPKGEIEPRTVEAPIEPARARPRSP